MPGIYGIRNESVLLQTAAAAEVTFSIPAESELFDGHFPQYRLLPAVGQFALAVRYARRFFGTGDYVPRIRRMKFSAPIVPEAELALRLTYSAEKQSVSFSFVDAAEDGKVYSSGTFTATEAGA